MLALPAAAAEGGAAAHGQPAETIVDVTCRIVDAAARSSRLPVPLLTRLVWTESRFRADAASPAGAQGIAQFMPATAAARGLADPFDPEQAIPRAAELLAELQQQFGNFGLAAAAYNAGPNRIAGWLGGTGSLPAETEAYVLAITGRTTGDWAADRRNPASTDDAETSSCIEITAALRADDSADPPPIAPWGVELSGNFSKPAALAAFERVRSRSAGAVGDQPPMVIGTVLRSRGTRRFYRVMVPAATRAEADRLCQAIAARGGSCVALRT